MRRQTPARTPIRKRQVEGLQSDALLVSVRVRPLAVGEESCVRLLNERQLSITTPECSVAFSRTQVRKEYQLTFGRIFESGATQHAVFEQTALGMMEDLVRGRSSVLFTYGATASGKTHTMVGSSGDPGLVPRCFDVLFNTLVDQMATKGRFKPDRAGGFDVQPEPDRPVEGRRHDVTPATSRLATSRGVATAGEFTTVEREHESAMVCGVENDWMYAVFVSFFEIYNDAVYDLLDDDTPAEPGPGKQPTRKQLREDTARGSVYVVGGAELEVATVDEAYATLQRGLQRRKVAHTLLNAESSRSHSVFSIRLVHAPRTVRDDKSALLISQLNLVDLAGSERAARTRAAGDRLKEAGSINESLAHLKQCIDVLRRNQTRCGTAATTNTAADGAQFREVAPYRNCKLTYLFKAFFDGAAAGRVAMLVCISPATHDFDESLQVLQFGVLAQDVQVSVCANAAERKQAILTREREKQLERQRDLAAECAMAATRRLFSASKIQDAPAVADENSNDKTTSGNQQDVFVKPLDQRPANRFDFNFPPHQLSLAEETDSHLLVQLATYLDTRTAYRSILTGQFDSHVQSFRQALADCDEQLRRLQIENDSLQCRLGAALQELQAKDEAHAALKRRINELEQAAAQGHDSTRRDVVDCAELRRALQERDVRLQLISDEAHRNASECVALRKQLALASSETSSTLSSSSESAAPNRNQPTFSKPHPRIRTGRSPSPACGVALSTALASRRRRSKSAETEIFIDNAPAAVGVPGKPMLPCADKRINAVKSTVTDNRDAFKCPPLPPRTTTRGPPAATPCKGDAPQYMTSGAATLNELNPPHNGGLLMTTRKRCEDGSLMLSPANEKLMQTVENAKKDRMRTNRAWADVGDTCTDAGTRWVLSQDQPSATGVVDVAPKYVTQLRAFVGFTKPCPIEVRRFRVPS